MPTEVSRADDTTTGSPIRSAICEAGPDPAERRDLQHRDVGGSEPGDPERVLGPTDRLVRGDRHLATRRRTAARSSTDAHGCSTYSRPPAARSYAGIRSHRRVDVPGAVGVDPDPSGRAERVADGGQPLEVVAGRLAGLGDLDLGRRAAGEPGEHAGDLARPTRRAPWRSPARGCGSAGGGSRSAASTADRHHARSLLAVVVPERAELAPARGALDEHALADRQCHGTASASRIANTCRTTTTVGQTRRPCPPARSSRSRHRRSATPISTSRCSGRPPPWTAPARRWCRCRRASRAPPCSRWLGPTSRSSAGPAGEDDRARGGHVRLDRRESRARCCPRSALQHSAAAALDRLGGPGQWLLALPTSSIAGLSVLVRSLVGGTRPECCSIAHDGFTVAGFVAATGAADRAASLRRRWSRRRSGGSSPGRPEGLAALASYDAVLVGGGAARRRSRRGRDRRPARGSSGRTG